MAITEFFISRYFGKPTNINGKQNYTLISIEDITATKGQSWEVWRLGSPGIIISDPINTYVPSNEATILFKLVGTSSAVEGDSAGLGKEHMQQFSVFLTI